MSHSTRMRAIRLELGERNISIAWSEQGLLSRIHLAADDDSAPAREFTIPDTAARLATDLKTYFETGAPISSVRWDDIDAGEWTDFQRKVYAAISAIPHGETRTYGWVAQRIGAPLATRAVGQALGRNPMPVLIPCHRVVSGKQGDRSLGGFMGEDVPGSPELQLKRKLLELESQFVNPRFAFFS